MATNSSADVPAASPLKSPRKKTPSKQNQATGSHTETVPIVAWHALSAEDVFRLLETGPSGISDAEAMHRRDTIFGPNVLTPPKKLGVWARLWTQINNILIWILLIAAVVSGVLHEWAEVALILIVVTVNVAIGLIQEGKAEKAAEALKAMLSPQATVVRNGARKIVEASNLVPGDVVFLQSGDRIPADVRLFDVTKLQVLEAMLTGESHPVAKTTASVLPTAPLGDRKCLAFAATLVMSGQACGVVVESGDFAEVGKISTLVSGTESGRTNLTVQLEIFGRWISAIVGVIALSTWLLAYLGRGFPLGEAFTSAVAVAVAIIPEGLPAVVTIVLAIGTQSMARQHAIIKSLPAVETLGSVTVICSDKTGTLTKNEMTAVAVRTAGAQYKVTGVGYAPVGTVEKVNGVNESSTVPLNAEGLAVLKAALACGVLCSDGDLRAPGATASEGSDKDATAVSVGWTAVGDPTEVALITLARKLGVDHRSARTLAPRLGALPFESEYKFMATAHMATDVPQGYEGAASGGTSTIPGVPVGTQVLFVKGAPDRLIPRCRHQLQQRDGSRPVASAGDASAGLEEQPADQAFWQKEAAALSSKGLRVLALCRATVPPGLDATNMTPQTIMDGAVALTMLCLVAILDPPRDEAARAVQEAHAAGITVKMITGDHRDTALAIGKMLHIARNGDVAYTGPELDAMPDAQLDAVVMGCNVFARASPENKIRIVQSLQRLRQVSSMTGDGVNDAPALKAANIGVAMGITGTDVSKEAAKMVLADDNFATIVSAIREGRRVWDNLVKILTYNTPVNIAQGMTTFFAYALAMPHAPLTAIATLYVNMITSVAMGMAFAFEPAEDDIMDRPPRRPGTRLFSIDVLWRNFFVGGIMIVAILGTFELALADGLSLHEARAEAFTQLVFAEIAYVFNCRYLKTTSLQLGAIRGNVWILLSIAITAGLQVLIVYTPGINTFFYCEPIRGMSWARVLGFSACVFLAVEVEKQVLHYIRPGLSVFLHAVSAMLPSALRVPHGAVAANSPVTGVPAAVGVPVATTTVDGEQQHGHAARGHAVQSGMPAVMDNPMIAAAVYAASAAQTASAVKGDIQKSPSLRHVPAHVDPTQAELDSVRFIATSASSFGVPIAESAASKPGEAAHRPKAMSTADMFAASVVTQLKAAEALGRTSPALGSAPPLDSVLADGGPGAFARAPAFSLSAVSASLAALPEVTQEGPPINNVALLATIVEPGSTSSGAP